MSETNNQNLERKRHTLAHLLASVVLKKYPEAKLTLGPAVENGFYYDFELPQPISDKDFPKIEHVYNSYRNDIKTIYGKGITYTKIIDDISLDRQNIEQRIANHEFEIIIYGSVHRGLLFHDLVCTSYPKEKIVYLCGEDAHYCTFANLNNMFIREHDYKY